VCDLAGILNNPTHAIHFTIKLYYCPVYVYSTFLNLCYKTIFCEIILHKREFLCYYAYMNDELLKEIGLSELQAQTYLYLLEHGPTSPPSITTALKITRTNAYKVLDQLHDLRLVNRTEVKKKFVYNAEDPIALASLVAEERNRVLALEKNTKEALKKLRLAYQKQSTGSEVQTYQGAVALKALYEHQITLKQPIYFVKTRADIPFMGYETMDRVRTLPVKFGTQRYGIIPDAPEAAVNNEINSKSNLERTWMFPESYTAPVEWTVSGDELMMIVFNENGTGIRIKNSVIAESFRQLWKMLDKNLKANPDYQKHPLYAKREV
jgi:predicted transcriptional regulator